MVPLPSLGHHRSAAEGKKTWWSCRMALTASAQMQHVLLLLIFHQSKPATSLLSPDFNMLPPEKDTESHSDSHLNTDRMYTDAVHTLVSTPRYRSQLLRKVLISFWTMKSGPVIFHLLLATSRQFAGPALYFRLLILVKYVPRASLVLFRFVQ